MIGRSDTHIDDNASRYGVITVPGTVIKASCVLLISSLRQPHGASPVLRFIL